MDIIIDALSDGVIDTLKLVPFLLATYVVMELLEHGASAASERFVRDAGHAGPVVGAVLGALPQCGFSAMAATLYAGRVVTLGTLLAVFLSTSDEMLPVFIASQAPLSTMAAILGSKVALGLVAGLAIDAVLRALHRAGDGHIHIHELCERAHCHCEEEDEKGHGADEDASEGDATSCGTCVHDGHEHGSSHVRAWSVVRSALVHTLQVSFFILLVSVALDIVISLVGTDAFAAVAAQH
ncbi:MAG: putative manganese transporter, partial [Atopobiaceae bacterium]|nr:putative manganese transporter [Atopobiaceae bacterium]